MTQAAPPTSAPPSSHLLAETVGERPVTPVDVPVTTVDKPITNRPCLLMGWSFRETTGAAVAAVELFNGAGTGGARVGEQALASAGSGSQGVPFTGLWCDGGLFLHIVSGSVTGSVWIRV